MGVTVSGGKWNYKAVAEQSRKKKFHPIFMRLEEETGLVAQYWGGFLREPEKSNPRKILYLLLNVRAKRSP